MNARTQLLLWALGVTAAVYVATAAMTASFTAGPMTIVGFGLIGVGLCKQARDAQRGHGAAPAAADAR